MNATQKRLLALGFVALATAAAGQLKPPAYFDGIKDVNARSAAIFTEAGRVIQSPRCLNCHPVTRQPTQGDDLHAHVPPMREDAPGMPCASCHGPATVTTLASSIESVPGHAHWGLAPASMAWQGKTLSEICKQVKDASRNGGRTLAQIQEHMGSDSLVGWAWHPGPGRVPAPGTQKQFGVLIHAWIATGAHCPE